VYSQSLRIAKIKANKRTDHIEDNSWWIAP
jgi:hypothetical protein